MKRSHGKSWVFAWLFALLSITLALALACTVFIIVKLNRNNLFSKNILLDNNYFMDYSVYEYKPEEDEVKNVYSYGMVTREYITYDDNGNSQICSTLVPGEIKDHIDKLIIRLKEMAPGYMSSIVISNAIENKLYSIYGIFGMTEEGDREAESYLLQHGFEIVISDRQQNRVCLDVPYVSQENGFPNGCEAVSATMLLRYCGFDIDPGDFIDDHLECKPTYIKWGCRYGPNPKLAYVGDPRDEDEGFGCFAPVIVKALNSYLPEGYYAKNTTGLSLNSLKTMYIDKGIPVAVWVTVDMEEVDRILQWQSEDKSETYLYPSNEHCMVLIGYDGDRYIFADPYGSRGVVEYPAEACVLAYNSLGMQSVAVIGSYAK